MDPDDKPDEKPKPPGAYLFGAPALSSRRKADPTPLAHEYGDASKPEQDPRKTRTMEDLNQDQEDEEDAQAAARYAAMPPEEKQARADYFRKKIRDHQAQKVADAQLKASEESRKPSPSSSLPYIVETPLGQSAPQETREEKRRRETAEVRKLSEELGVSYEPEKWQAEAADKVQNQASASSQDEGLPPYNEALYGPPPPPIQKKWWHIGPLKPKPRPLYPPPIWKTHIGPDGQKIRMMHASRVPYPTPAEAPPPEEPTHVTPPPRLQSDLSRPLYALAGAILLAALITSCGGRYAINDSAERTYEIDRWTGRTWYLNPKEKRPVEASE